MERTEKVLEEIYKVLGINFAPTVVNVPIHSIEIKSIDVELIAKISGLEIERFHSKLVGVSILDKEEKLKGKINNISISFLTNISSNLGVVNSVFIKRYPNSWKDLPEEIRIKLIAEIRDRWPQYIDGIKIIGVYKDIPLGRIKNLLVDEKTGILSFNLREEYTEEKKANLIVFKFLKDETLRSIAF
ncbi:MAG: hypothetical protein N2380_05035 [bacterium]|nr:hypothetical protein [bacterium]